MENDFSWTRRHVGHYKYRMGQKIRKFFRSRCRQRNFGFQINRYVVFLAILLYGIFCMLVTFQSVINIIICLECDVGAWLSMLVTWLVTNTFCPTFVTNIDVTIVFGFVSGSDDFSHGYFQRVLRINQCQNQIPDYPRLSLSHPFGYFGWFDISEKWHFDECQVQSTFWVYWHMEMTVLMRRLQF